MDTELLNSGCFVSDGLPIKHALDRYHERRQQLLSSCSCITALSGTTQPFNQENHWFMTDTKIIQEPNMLYLTGLNQSFVGLLIDPISSQVHLYLPKQDLQHAFWEGECIAITNNNEKELAKWFQVDTVRPYDTMGADFKTMLLTSKQQQYGLMWFESSSSKGLDTLSQFKMSIQELVKPLGHAFSCLNMVSCLKSRWILDAVDCNNLKKANTITASIFTNCCKQLSQYHSETEVAGFIKGEIIKQSWVGESFPAIVAAGKNAATLHYRYHNQPLPEDALLLLDFGCRVHTMPADISRTIPISGRFNPMQNILYQIVLDAQEHVEGAVRSCITIDALNTMCWTFIERALDERFIQQGGTIKKPYHREPHNVSHLIGHTVHDGDPGRSYRYEPLQAGMVISNEPGLYGEVSMKINGVHYHEVIGIRIEDDLLVTENGCENLSKECVKSIDDIEALLS